MENLLLETPRLLIRNLDPACLPEFHAYRSDPEVTKYQGFDVMRLTEAAKFIESQKNKRFGRAGEWVQYAIIEKSSQTLIGDCAIRLQEDDPRIAETGITISPLHQRHGFAKEALNGILKFLFEEQQIHRVVETVDAENTASIALLKSTKFRLEGHFIENIFFKGAWGSEYQYAMLQREWLKK